MLLKVPEFMTIPTLEALAFLATPLPAKRATAPSRSRLGRARAGTSGDARSIWL